MSTNFLFTVSTLCISTLQSYAHLNIIFFIILNIHFFISIEKRKILHAKIFIIYCLLIIFHINIKAHLIIALLLNTILIIGGLINEKFNKE